MDLPVAETEVELTLITRSGALHLLLDQMRGWGYAVERIK